MLIDGFTMEGTMTKEKLLVVFSKAFCKFIKKDADLFEASKTVQERAFLFRFACYLKDAVEKSGRGVDGAKLKLDVEYNRDGDKVKQIDNGSDWMAPDIVFHERHSGALEGENQYRNDIFCCEAKKNGSPDGEDAKRVKELIKKMKYEFGIDFYRFARKEAEFNLYTKSGTRERYKFDGKNFVVQDHGEWEND